MDTNHQFIAYYTIVRKEVVRFLMIWTQTLLPPVITISLYYVIFGKFIGSQISNINGFTYIQFIVPGLVMMAVLTNAYSNVVGSFYGSKFQRSLEELLVSPAPSYVIIAGFVTGGVLRGLSVGVLVLAVSLFFTNLVIHSYLIIIISVILVSILFSIAGLLNGIYAKSFDAMLIVPTFVLTPLTYLGGVFYSIDLLPTFWQTVSLANPILYMVNIFRYGFLGVSDVNIWTSFGVILAILFVLLWFVIVLFKRGIGLKN